MSRALLAWLALPALLAAAGITWSLGCATDASAGFSGDDDSSVSSPESGSATCPAEDPQAGAACTQPEGTTCAVGACGTTYVACVSGAWTESPPQPVQFCPAQLPATGDACPRCFPQSIGCRYGCLGDAGVPQQIGFCVAAADGGLAWQMSALACPTYDAGEADADPEDGP